MTLMISLPQLVSDTGLSDRTFFKGKVSNEFWGIICILWLYTVHADDAGWPQSAHISLQNRFSNIAVFKYARYTLNHRISWMKLTRTMQCSFFYLLNASQKNYCALRKIKYLSGQTQLRCAHFYALAILAPSVGLVKEYTLSMVSFLLEKDLSLEKKCFFFRRV